MMSSRRHRTGRTSLLSCRTWHVALGGCVAVATASVSCGGSESKARDDAPDVTPSAGSSAGGTAGSTTRPNYYEDIAPILGEKCVGCHVDGGIAPFALDSAEVATGYAAGLAQAVESRVMPPWPPGPLSVPFRGDRSLSNEQIETIKAWARLGAPLGDRANAAPIPAASLPDLGVADATGDIGAYEPPTATTDVYRCFLVDPRVDRDAYITAFRLAPGNGHLVHHVITTLYAPDQRAAVQKKDDDDEGPGWGCGAADGGGGLGRGPRSLGELGSWVPGVSTVTFPKGTGHFLPANGFLVLQIHYNTRHGTGKDVGTKIDLKLASSEEQKTIKPLKQLRLATLGLKLPPNQAGIVQENDTPGTFWAGMQGWNPKGGRGYLVVVGGHMHLLGRRFTIEHTNEAGTTTVLDIPDWDFHWQGTYQLVTPIPVSTADAFKISCTYDNTEDQRKRRGHTGPMGEVTWGEGTFDEMCLGTLVVVDELPAP